MSQQTDLPRKVESLEALFQFLDERLAAAGADDRTSFCLKLSAEELFTNLVRHNTGGGDRITVRLQVSDDRVQLDLIDYQVERFDPGSVAPVDVERPVAERQPGGLGIHLVRSLVDRVSYEYENGTMKVSVVKQLGG